ncbi:hypothetical protein BKA83DRAFT_4131947 [Pisolithus microcarpus]|nr:hypothetical protein BKA83DRAFT_4131947 [Pisolithus microcarpus]
MSQRPRRSKANLHLGQIILDAQNQRCTSEQKQADDENLQRAKDAELAATQKAYEHVGAMETTDQRKSDLETETKLGTVKDHKQSEIGPKAREKTILKLRNAIEQARNRADAETEPSAAKDTNHEQAEIASKPREDKIMSKLRASSLDTTLLSDTPRRRWGLSDIDPPSPDEAQDYEECKDQTAIVIDDEYSDMENVGKADAFNTHHVNTSVSAIDAVAPCRADKGIGPGHRIVCHQVQKSRSSIALNLPLLFLKGRKWAKTYLPTLLLWLRDQPNVWSVPEGDLVHALMEITKVVYPTFTTLDDICLNMPIFSVASQHLSGWCHSMGSTAIALLECYLASDPDTDVKQTCDALLHNCAGSVDVPALGLAPKPYMVRGAIGLCVAALERAIKQVKSKFISTDAMGKGRGGTNFLKANHKHKSSGRPANAEHTFLEQNWGSATSSYFQSIVNHESHVLQGIVWMAYAVLQDDSDDNSSVEDQTEELLEGEVDACALMCKSSISFVCCTNVLAETRPPHYP